MAIERGVKMQNPLDWTNKQKLIYERMNAIIRAMNDMELKDLVQMDREINRDEALGPLIDPTAWRAGKFKEVAMIKKVVRAIIAFKKEVSGAGRFQNVDIPERMSEVNYETKRSH